jgi:hypothetical protein
MNFQVPRLESIGYFAKSLPTAAPESQRDHGADGRRFSYLINTDEVFGTQVAVKLGRELSVIPLTAAS